ncbi:MAG: arsenate reductase ArsC [Flavobacteriales bacterium]|nr:arsenate reductase ArsC [Flavobacteriales bacterium]
MKKILVLCTGNSCRSQMAEAYLRFYAKNKAVIYSAGIETHGLNPKAVECMMEDGIDISRHTSNNVNEFIGIPFDLILTVCDHANENCPYFPSNAKRLHQSFPDPAKASGSDEEIKVKFREVRDQIRIYCKDFVNENL